MKPIVFNGKFLTAAPTGVHRVAEELILAMDRLLAARKGEAGLPEAVVIAPSDAARTPPLAVIPVVVFQSGRKNGRYLVGSGRLLTPFRPHGVRRLCSDFGTSS